MNLKHFSVIQIIRHFIQLLGFILFPELFITVLHALGDVITALLNGNFSISTLSSQMITISVILLITAVWGRFFCGFLCSFGTLQELLFSIRKKVFPNKCTISPKFDHMLKYIKYLVLLFIIVFLWVMALPMNSSFSPWGVFGMLISGNLSIIATAVNTVGFAILLLFLIGSLFIERFFCRYFCPLGALFTIISGKRCYKIKRNESTCINCGLCEKKCSMGISILKNEEVSSGDCIDCMQCITICPKECLYVNPSPAIAGTTAAIAMCGLVQIGTLTVPDDMSTLREYSFDQSEKGNYVDGIYTGVGTGFRGDTEVQVTVENGYITDITILSYEDDTEFFQKAQSSILNQILSEQSVDVQNVSGATFSCNSIINAVANALGIEKQTETGHSDDQQKEIELNPSTNSEQTVPNELSGTDSVEEITPMSELASIIDGTYEGEGTGFRGTTKVSVTVENGKIVDIIVVSYEDDEQFFVRAEDDVISEIINAQSLDVSCVSGATFSSNGILEAVANALNIDFDNPNQYNTNKGDKGGHGKGDFGKRLH